jgi:hypothetical protein
VEIIGVGGRDSFGSMADFVDRHGLGDTRQIADVDGAVWGRFNIVGQPAWIFIDGETGERETVLGALGGERLQAMAEALSG